jgi:hypothetical protein
MEGRTRHKIGFEVFTAVSMKMEDRRQKTAIFKTEDNNNV